jgi:hypothetical protein
MRTWQPHFDEYLTGRERHVEASRAMNRATRIFHKLLEHGVDDDRAYELAGVHLADCRDVRAYADERAALHRLGEALTECPTAERYQAIGAVVAVTHEWEAANDD